MKRFIKSVCSLALAVLMAGCVVKDESNSSENSRLRYMLKGSVMPVSNSEETDNKVSDYEPINYDVQKSVWLSYIDLSPMLTGKSETEFSEEFEQACRNITQLGCNTIYVHLRPFGDAIYNSELHPYSKYVTGTAGQQGSFDPLKIMLETSHKYKLSVHGWINPLRCEEETNFKEYDDKYLIKQWYDDIDNCECIKRVEGDTHLWLNPACEQVRKLIADGVSEIVENYNIDGIHYDDYFYPTTDKSFDEQCYADFYGSDSLEQWRLDNISEMVKDIYNAAKNVDKRVIVGASPQGNIENNYAYMYADVKKWCSEDGYIDYICPQIYYGYENPVKPYLDTVEAWKQLVTDDNVSLVTGLAVYKIFSDEEEFFNTEGIIAQQINDSIEKSGTDGVALYKYVSLFSPQQEFQDRMKTELEKIRNILH